MEVAIKEGIDVDEYLREHSVLEPPGTISTAALVVLFLWRKRQGGCRRRWIAATMNVMPAACDFQKYKYFFPKEETPLPAKAGWKEELIREKYTASIY